MIVPARNAARHLATQLEALAGQTYPEWWEVLLVDNGSRDRTVAVGRAWSERLPRLRIVHASERGANVARNTGAAAAGGDVLVFCDADDRASARWLEALVGAVATAELATGPLDVELLNAASIRHWRRPPVVTPDGLLGDLGFLPYAPAGNLAIRAPLFHSLGGFAVEYRGWDEVALCWRALLQGQRIAYSPDAVMHYRYRDNVPDLLRQYAGLGFAQPRLFREFRSAGMPRGNVARSRNSLRMLRRSPSLLRRSSDRERWLAWMALLAGRVAGSVRQRVLYL